MSPEAQAEGPRHVRPDPDVHIEWCAPTALVSHQSLYIRVGDPNNGGHHYWVVFIGVVADRWVDAPPGFRLGVRLERSPTAPVYPRNTFVNWADVPPSVHAILRDLTPTLQALIDVREGERV